MLDALALVGAKVNHRGLFGYTPLIEAGYLGYREIIDCLIKHGAVFTARDGVGHSILGHIIAGQGEMKEQLLEHLSPFASQVQLDRALRYDFDNTNQHTAVLVKLGANPNNVGLSAGDTNRH
jgi:ankyrin repeat protein